MAAAPSRLPFAAGDYLTRFPAPAPYRLRIDSPFAKPGWQARRAGDQVRPPYAGTPVLFEGTPFEVVHLERRDDGGISYYLNPWDERFPLRPAQEYSAAACERVARQVASAQHRQAAARTLVWLGPLLGLLPARDQLRLEHELSLPAVRNSTLSAALVAGAAAGLGVVGLAVVVSSRPAPAALAWAPALLPLAGYLLVESIARLVTALKFDEPMGSLLVWLPVTAYRTVRDELATRRATPSHRRRPRPTPPLRDEVRSLGDDELEVSSALPKPHWTINRTGIYVGDVCYRLVERGQRQEAPGYHHLFRLRRVDLDEPVFFKEAVQYQPEEVQRLVLDERRAALHTWVDTCAPLLGFLDAASQRQLQRVYGFDAARHTRWSAVIGGVLGVVAAMTAGSLLTGGEPRLGDLVVFLLGLALLAESVARWRLLGGGRISGGVLGHLLKPLARPLLDASLLPSRDTLKVAQRTTKLDHRGEQP